MNHGKWTRVVVFICTIAMFALLGTSPALAAGPTLNVDCNAGQTITGAVTKLEKIGAVGSAGPNTILVSGTCNENVTIVGMNNLTLQGNPTATVNGTADGNGTVLWVTDSQNFSANNITLSGAGVSGGVYCAAATCHLNNDTVENSVGIGVGVGPSAFVQLMSTTIQQNARDGVHIGGQGNAVLGGATIQSNGGAGVYVQVGGSLLTTLQGQGYNITGPAQTVIQNNAQDGILVDVNSTARINFTSISGNGRDGLRLSGGAKAQLASVSITGNTGHGVRVGDLSFVQFAVDNSIAGNNSGAATPLDVVCDPQYSATRGMGGLSGTTSNCPAEPPTNP
jgi:Right handed beta helix region